MAIPPILAFGLPQGPEWFYITFVVILLFGAKKLPELARGLGKSIGEFKKAKEDFTKEIENASVEDPIPKSTAPTDTKPVA